MKRRIFGVILMLFASTSFVLATPNVAHAATDDPVTCDSGGPFTWVVCGVIKWLVGAIDWVRDEILVPFLQEQPLSNTTPDGKIIYKIWGNFRNVASLFFIIIFFLVIFGTALGWDNYTMKKILPRLVAGAVLVPFSWWICVLVVDLGNILGQGAAALVSPLIPPVAFDFTSSITKIFLGGGVLLGVAGAYTAVTTIGLAVIISLAIAFAVVMVTLVVRKLLITLCIVLSPLAFLALILPNTEKLGKRWWSNFIRLDLMYFIIMMFFQAGRLVSALAGSIAGGGSTLSTAADNAVVVYIQFLGIIAGLLATPFSFNMAGEGMGAASKLIGRASSAAEKKWGKDSDWGKDRAEQRQKNNARRALDPTLFGSKALGKTPLGSIKRGLALKRSGLGSTMGNANIRIPGTNAKLRIPGLGVGMNAAQRVKLNKVEEEATKELAVAAAQTNIRKQMPQSSAQRVASASAAAYDKLFEQRMVEALNVRRANGQSIAQTNLGGLDINYLKELFRTGDDATKAAVLSRLSQSQGGIKAAHELRTGKKIVEGDDGSITEIDEWKNADGSLEQYSLGHDAAGNPITGTATAAAGGMGGDYDSTITRTDQKHIWDKGMANAKADDVKKPVKNAAQDMSGSDVAGMSVHQVRRYMDFYDKNLTQAQARMAANPPGSAEYIAGQKQLAETQRFAAQFNAAFQTAYRTPSLKGQMLPEMVEAVARAGAAGRGGINAETAQVAQQHVGHQNQSEQLVSKAGSQAVMSAVGNDIVRASEIHQHIRQEIATTGSSPTQAHIEATVANGGALGAGDFSHVTASGATSSMPAAVQAKVVAELGSSVSDLARVHQKYEDDLLSGGNYVRTVEQAANNNTTIPQPVDRPTSP